MNIKEMGERVPLVMGSSYKDIYVSIHTARLLKECEFHVPTRKSFTIYHNDNENEQDGKSGPFGWEAGEVEFTEHFFANNSDVDYSNEAYTSYAFPTVVVAQSWLREVKGVNVWVTPNLLSSRPNDWTYNIVIYDKGRLVYEIRDKGEMGLYYEKALDEGLTEALEFLIKRKEE